MSESELVEWSVLGSENLQSQVRIHSSSKNNFAQIDNNLTRNIVRTSKTANLDRTAT